LQWAQNVLSFISSSGELDRTSFSAFLGSELPLDALIKFVFLLYDTDGSGTFSKTEFTALLTDIKHHPSIKTLAALFDTPLSLEDFKRTIITANLSYLFCDHATILFRFANSFRSANSSANKNASTLICKSYIASLPACGVVGKRYPTVFRYMLFSLTLIYLTTTIALILYVIFVAHPGLSAYYVSARVGGLLINFNLLLLLGAFLSRYLFPLVPIAMNANELHAAVGFSLMIWAAIHTIGWLTHYANETGLGKSTPNITGFVLLAILAAMTLTGFRRRQSFRAFYYAHRLQYVFWVLLYFHSARPILFFCVPLSLYALYLLKLGMTKCQTTCTCVCAFALER
jgi:hypothetical protein